MDGHRARIRLSGTLWIASADRSQNLRAEAKAHQPMVGPAFKPPFLESAVVASLRDLLIDPAAFAKPAEVEPLGRALDSFDSLSPPRARTILCETGALGFGHAGPSAHRVPGRRFRL